MVLEIGPVTQNHRARTSSNSQSHGNPRPEAREFLLFAVAVALNWFAAHMAPHLIFSVVAMGLFGWMFYLLMRFSPRGAIILLPFLIVRASMIISLVFIDTGAKMPEMGLVGEPSDSTASFVAYISVFFFVAGAVFNVFERAFTRHVRSDYLRQIVRLTIWPIIGISLLAALALILHGLQNGFPLLSGVDRFFYRRYFGSPLLVNILNYKFVFAMLLGTVVFSKSTSKLQKNIAIGTFLGMTVSYFLFGDKFFTILVNACYFSMSYLLIKPDNFRKTIVKIAPFGAAIVLVMFGITTYIYSDYGKISLSETIERVSGRITGQGQLWYVANINEKNLFKLDKNLFDEHVAYLSDDNPSYYAFAHGLEQFYFIYKYSPKEYVDNARLAQGWWGLTAGYEAMALVIFGFGGAFFFMALSGAIVALPALYMLRAQRSQFMLSLMLATWFLNEAYVMTNQFGLWHLFGTHQAKVFVAISLLEAGLFLFNRGLDPNRRVE